MGWDRFYGFIGGEANPWHPTLVEDNHFVDQPYAPGDGYHLSKDLADHALQMPRDSHQSAPTGSSRASTSTVPTRPECRWPPDHASADTRCS